MGKIDSEPRVVHDIHPERIAIILMGYTYLLFPPTKVRFDPLKLGRKGDGHTVWKLESISGIHILRVINLCKCTVSKPAI